MSKAKLAAARELIEDQDYDAARAVLETMPTDDRAQRWLEKLPKGKRKRRFSLSGCLVVILLGVVIFALIVQINQTRDVLSDAALAANADLRAAGVIGGADVTDTPGPSPTITETSTPTLTLTPSLTPTPTTAPTATATIAPLIFSGNEATVLGPMAIPAGLYRVTVTTNGYASVKLAVSSGECGSGTSFLNNLVLLVARGQAANGAEAIFTSRGCVTLIEVSNVQGPWTLSFEIT